MKHILNFTAFMGINIPIGMFITGWSISTLFNWFIVPFGIEPIGFAHALGLSALCGCLFSVGIVMQLNNIKESEEWFLTWIRTISIWAGMIICVCLGWFYKIMM
jgi:hypothetical protein